VKNAFQNCTSVQRFGTISYCFCCSRGTSVYAARAVLLLICTVTPTGTGGDGFGAAGCWPSSDMSSFATSAPTLATASGGSR
jgi:hypothetical protein